MVIALILGALLIAVVTIAVWLDLGPVDDDPIYYAHDAFDPSVDLTMIRLVTEPYDWETAREPDWIE
jgi:hypothetical protein